MSESVAAMGSHLAHLMLIQERTKCGMKRSDLLRLIVQDKAEDRASTTRLFREALEEADRILETNLGYKIREIPGKSVYILANTLNFKGVEDFLQKDSEWIQIRGLLCIILSFILMMGGEVREDQLWNFLGDLNIAMDDKNHETFGDVDKLIKTTLARWHYLEFIKEKNGPSSLRWGFRSEVEFDRMELLNFVAGMYGEGRTARDFSEIYAKLEAERAARSSDSQHETSSA